MNPFLKIRWKHRLISVFPSVCKCSEILSCVKYAALWRKDGWISPPPYFVRRAMLRSEAIAINAEIFVETGTFLGDTSWDLMENFRKITTLEVEPKLAALARDRFRKHPTVHVEEGDSAERLPEICRQIDAPCLFYLDGHYSGGITGMGSEECPILSELKAIFTHTQHPFRIVIDDARLFGADPCYPGLDVIEKFLSTEASGFRMRVENDAIIIS